MFYWKISGAVVLTFFVLFFAGCTGAVKRESREYKTGVMVSEIDSLLNDYTQPDAFEKIAEYGTDSRYYVMIRGWLVQELSGTESLVESTKGREELQKKHMEKAAFLRKLIRRIDLE